MVLPLEAVVRCFIGGNERAGQAVCDRPTAAKLDAKGNCKIHLQVRDARGVSKQGVEGFEMVSERLLRLFEPGENAAIALVQDALRRADLKARDNLVDELAFAVRRQCRNDLLVIEDTGGDQNLFVT